MHFFIFLMLILIYWIRGLYLWYILWLVEQTVCCRLQGESKCSTTWRIMTQILITRNKELSLTYCSSTVWLSDMIWCKNKTPYLPHSTEHIISFSHKFCSQQTFSHVSHLNILISAEIELICYFFLSWQWEFCKRYYLSAIL